MPRKKMPFKPSIKDWSAIARSAKTLIGVAGILENELPDIKQELALQLCAAAGKYRKYMVDRTNGRPIYKKQSWETFRAAILRHAYAKIVRERVKPSARFAFAALAIPLDCELSANHGFDDSEPVTLQDMLTQDGLISDGTEKQEIAGVSLQVDVSAFMQSLPRRLRPICVALQSMSPYEAARELAMEYKQLQRRMKEIRELMLESGLDVYL